MKVLISNDDGIQAPGIAALAEAFSAAGHEVVVVAPDGQRSAASHSLTLFAPLVPRKAVLKGASCAYAVNGTPVDCVKLGIRSLCPDADFVVSGINHGYNMGTDVLYSGTVAAAMEGALSGIPSIAISNSPRGEANYDKAAEAALLAFELLRKHPIGSHKLLNVNYPETAEALGVKFCPLRRTEYSDHYDKRENQRVGDFYWLIGGAKEGIEPGDDDQSWLEKGYITMTVVSADMTDLASTKALEELL